jgi:hypothetical protein
MPAALRKTKGVVLMAANAADRLPSHSLEDHLRNENPLLAEVVKSYRRLDRITSRLGFFDPDDSHTSRIPWWPLISILGTYSSGKSAFINNYLQYHLQATGNQAVDDKFTVICYTNDNQVRSLPGLALDADPRFPLYKVGRAIDEVESGQSAHIDKYLQLKTCPSDTLRGRILIDSPGFDADEQRNLTLRITDHIIDLSDLVLVFFDARHPESGSMHDTLKHLVSSTVSRRDANKFLFILNQIDQTANEDNLDEVFAAWKRALAGGGLTTGCCYAVYNPELAVPIVNDQVRIRLEHRLQTDMRAIHQRIEQVGVERAYRIVGMLKKTVQEINEEIVPRVETFLERWRKAVLWTDAALFGGIIIAFFALTLWGGFWEGWKLKLPLWPQIAASPLLHNTFWVLLIGAAVYLHFRIRQAAAERVGRRIIAEIDDANRLQNYQRAFARNTRWWRSVFLRKPAGWRTRSRKILAEVLEQADDFIRTLNDAFANPSGRSSADQCGSVSDAILPKSGGQSTEVHEGASVSDTMKFSRSN